ncbi:uncharacterized protein LOC136079342 [Hydra vulgaris]|uniref:Uncharacterized protein LOC136079342 n=1 Tax=Hydra vulgaris TaxID=6087 RepID=A0ABM4BPU6_HYDVU
MIQRVQSPTRISSTTGIANLLDLVINRHDDISLNNIQVTDEGISDHYMIRVAFYHQPSNSKTVWFSKRNFRKLNLSCFIKELQVMPCCLSPENNVDDYAEQIRSNITTVLDHLAPIRKYSMQPGKHDDKWLSSDAKNKKIRHRKLEPYDNQKETWNIAKKLLHSNSYKTKNTIPEAKCNIISQYFINKLESIKNTIQERLAKNPKSKFISELHPPVNILPTFGIVTPTDVSKIIKALKPKTSPLDIIPTYILKSCSELFSPIITHLANLSFKSGIFPASYKVAQITPIPKKSGLAEFDLSNLRPISNLNTISKILEKLALSRLLPHVTSSINFNPFSICLLISRIKDEFGVTDIALKWLTSYLHSQKSFVSIGSIKSRLIASSTGVPQGSVLGPFLFSMFVSPLYRIIAKLGTNPHQYADDT